MAQSKKQKTTTQALKSKVIPGPVTPKARINYLLLFPLLIITLAFYWPSLSNQLTNWDDQEYITFNKNLADASFEKHFSEVPEVMGNYHPLTMVTLAWDYANAYDESTGIIDPVPFHRTNLLYHVLNTLLVYLLIFKLSKSNTAAAFTAAVFALHPMHVESVAWASERKDVLYTFFYLGGLLTWVHFIDGKNKVLTYVLTFALFILALFSKAVAVSLPLALLAIDYYRARKWNWKIVVEKIPFLVLSVWFGYIAIEAQRNFESLSGNETWSLGERLLFACYGTTQYVIKFFAPFNLSCFYPYPSPGYPLHFMYYAGPVFVAVILYLLYRYRRNREVMFGSLFFFITVALVLQIMSVGGAVMADRYTYLPYVGIGFIMGMMVDKVIQKKMAQKQMAVFVPFAFILLLSLLTWQRTLVWQNSITLWTDAESKEKLSPKIYNNFGDAYNIAGEYQKAIEMLDKAIVLNSTYPDAYYNRGRSWFFLNQLQKSVDDYTKAIEYNPRLSQAWYNRAGTYFNMGRLKEAKADALKAQELGYKVDPMFFKAIEQGLAAQPQR